MCITTLRPLTLLSLTLLLTRRMATESIYSDDGWRPISNEKLLSGSRRNFIKPEENELNSQTPWHSHSTSPDNTLSRGNFIKLVGASHKAGESLLPQREINANLESGDHNQSTLFYPNNNLDTNYDDDNTPIDNLTTRKAKKLYDSNDSAVENIIEKYNDKELLKLESKHTYAVTEDEDEQITNSNQRNIINEDNGYIYETPKSELSSNVLTNSFIKILSNYNIRSSDKLPNYSLSLRQNSRNSPKNDYTYFYIPIKVPLKYNNPNHLLVDPLLAVFLSNYGYYLPGNYGIQSNYRNIYGYGASNNIHNNKPFGSYKLFSDTDASHK
ncbi:uncharacterized protein LOC126969966 [Leptidea sinapis]|uniref:uncharacterized protein LOC126969966 n=1 Tax=Leptidea sinapis TaxID=189913 RepID=UPI00213088B5|nr:uncharacterized protein LOC126969966 [Leptidea sinapis]